MATYTVEIDGKRYDIQGDRPPSEEEARSAISEYKPAQSKGRLDKIAESTQSTEGKISSRPSMVADLVKDPTTLQRFKKHPLGTALRTVGGALEYTQGVPASIGLALQRGRPQDILPDIGKTLTGQRPAQAGDIMRSVGTPEPIAAGVGLLADANKLSPSTGISNVMAGAGKATQIPKLINQFGKPMLAKALSVLSDVPQEKVAKALDNPQLLSSRFLKKEGKVVQEQYKKVVEPLIADSKNVVNTSSLGQLRKNLNLINDSSEATKVFRSMKPGEQKKIVNWINEISKGKLSFNRVDGIIGEIDSAKKSVYQRMAAGNDVDYSDDFIRTATKLRESLNSARKTQFPEAGKVLERYEQYKVGQSVNKQFERYMPHLMPAIVVGALSVGAKNPAYNLATLGAIPKVQSLGIQAGSLLGSNVGKSGSILANSAFEEWRRQQR